VLSGIENTEGTLDKTKFAYLAGLIDGEGSFCISRVNTSFGYSFARCIVVANTDKKVMKWLVQNFGGRVKVFALRNPEKHKRRLQWLPNGTKNLENLVLGILPYLVIKREQAKVFLEFIREDRSMSPELLQARIARKDQLCDKMHELNRKGPVETDTQDDCEARSKIQSELMGDHESDHAETHVS
jgi:hypothetical protein